MEAEIERLLACLADEKERCERDRVAMQQTLKDKEMEF
jgi:hypothetical protein